MMKLAIIRGAQQILRDIKAPGTGEVPIEDFVKFVGVSSSDIDELLEGVRIELASRTDDSDFVILLENGKLIVERKIAKCGLFKVAGDASSISLSLEERKALARKSIEELPDSLKHDDIGINRIADTLKLRTYEEVYAIIVSSFFISCEKKNNIKFWQAVMNRMKDAKDKEQWSRRLEEASLNMQRAEEVVRKTPASYVKEEIKNGVMIAKGVLPSFAMSIIHRAKKDSQ